MKCIAIACQSDLEAIKWHLPQNNLIKTLFIKSAQNTYQPMISEFLESIGDNNQYIICKDGYFIHIQKIAGSSFVVVTDIELSITQVYYLSKAVLLENIDIKIVAADLATYAQHRQIAQTQDELALLKLHMLDNIEKLLERGEKIDDLVIRTETLSEEALTFKIKTQELNTRCLPMGCSIL